MTKKINFYTLLLLAANTSSFCAINNNKPKPQPAKIIATIAINDALSILSITHNHIAISYPSGCSIWDYSTNKEIFQLIQHNKFSNYQHIALNNNGTKLALSYINVQKPSKNHLSIYNTSTGERILKTTIPNETGKIPVFSTTDDNAILIYALSFNTTKKQYITPYGSIYTLPTNKLLFNLSSYFTSGKYSPSGKLIGLCDMHGSCAIFDTQSQKINYLIEESCSRYDKIDAIDFDPTNHILAIIPSLGKSIEYWNAETRNLIAISELPEQYTKIEYSPTTYSRITFSSNGKEIIIAMKDTCLALQVPFEIFDTTLGIGAYKLDTKNKCLSFLSILNQFILVPIPTDIKRLLIYSFLKISKVGDDY